MAITTAAPLPDAALDRLGRPAGCPAAAPTRSGVASIEATVDDAATNLPDLLAELHAHDVDVVSSSEVTPDYDDVFVRLIEEHRGQRPRKLLRAPPDGRGSGGASSRSSASCARS